MTSKEYSNDNQVWRSVPLKLLPLNERYFTTEWAQKTYSYRFLFDISVTSQSYKCDSEVEDWRLQALQMMKEIKQIGIACGRQEIVNIARDHYGMTMAHACNSKPTNIDDVISIIGSDDWYNNNKIYKQNIIYHLMYGLTRSGMNAWLLKEERKWLQTHQIHYDDNEVGIKKTKLRGFVYSIMNSKFSNSTIKLFHTVMKRKFGEFITVQKPIHNVNSNLLYSECHFFGGIGYLVTCQNYSEHLKYTEGETIKDIGQRWIALCQEKHKMSVADIHSMVDDLCKKSDSCAQTEDVLDKPLTITPEKVQLIRPLFQDDTPLNTDNDFDLTIHQGMFYHKF